MKLVSTVKLQRAKGRAEKSKTYFNCMYETVVSMLSKAGDINHPYLKANNSTKKAVIVITGSRGLAGGYNSNIIKLVRDNEWNKDDLIIYPVEARDGIHLQDLVMRWVKIIPQRLRNQSMQTQ
jgi:F-type H+-transporting ATPase subunit gamma